MRRAFSAIELVTALALLAIVLALIGRATLSNERLQRALAASHTEARGVEQTVAILSAVLAPAVPQDLASEQLSDSAIELDALVGTAVACVTPTGLTTGEPARDGPALASLSREPQTGDVALLLDEGVVPPTWRSIRIDAVTSGATSCDLMPGDTGRALDLVVPPGVGPLAVVHIVRHVRFSLYRSGDGRWYLGMRDWNAATNRFNAVQPVSGPLAPYSADPARSGLHFTYRDSAGTERPPHAGPDDGVRIVEIVARADAGGDSAQRTVGSRDAP
jgi:hypothetical protein